MEKDWIHSRNSPRQRPLEKSLKHASALAQHQCATLVEENLRIHTFTEIPSPEIFSSQIEAKNVPAVFKKCIMNWKAFSKWNPSHGGLIYLQERVGSVAVEAMLSRSAPVFYGDIRSHEREHTQLKCLGEDIQTPLPLETKIVASVNLWMNSMKARSSTHYDPHHNLLCLVSGCKEVTLWPPSATPYLYTRPLYGEASNHSSVTLEEPDLSVYPRSACLNGFLQKVVLHAGDALFIPEGWFHQVDSEDLTIAVNFWWRSMSITGMLEHMDAYYLCRLLKRLTDKEMANNAYRDHGHQGINRNCGNKSSNDELRYSSAGENDETNKRKEDSSSINDDPVANLILTLHPLTIRNVFLAMADYFPRTLEALVLHALTPVGSEILTRKFEEMDQLISEDQNQFYQIFYGLFDDQSAAMDALLNGKELFAHQSL
ncbi:hypothetical protein K7X08_005663 [Anisodus acutangulus]|uniref:JmjC domain-containing protein n=1 Tax=Anisodus acutangulus TaxID=402998 RepID=A0A9Q1R8F0_9SOLA|nr:hypothetical protein K7X08_005663 [Anisodus acutangulus]